jgi:hypothetical protein
VVGEGDGLEAQMLGLDHEFLAVRGAAQEGEIAGDLEFGVLHGAHANRPWMNQAGRAVLAVEALAEQPVAPAGGILDHIVVAGPGGRAAPPFRCDALRPLGARHVPRHPAPGKAHRRPVGHRGHGLDRLGPVEEDDRAGSAPGFGPTPIPSPNCSP